MNNEAVNKAKKILSSINSNKEYTFSDYETINEIRIGFEEIDLINKIIHNITVVLNSNLDFIRIESYCTEYVSRPSPPTEN